MKPAELLNLIRDTGLTISILPDSHLEVSPADRITNDIRMAIIQCKSDLVKYITIENSLPKVPPTRTWTAGNSYICKCGQLTGWRVDDQPFCPVCFYDYQHGPDLEDNRPTPGETPQHAIKNKTKPSPVALAWLFDHRQLLDDAGWTRAELYRRNKYKQGIAWLKLWDKAFLLAYLHDDGVIEFECSSNGRDFIQTARPASFWAKPIDKSPPKGETL